MRRPDYDEAFDRLLRLEGYISDHRADPGGHTIYGVARERHPEVHRELAGAPDAIQQQEIARAFYRRRFWTPLRCDGFSSHYVAEELFEAGVNMGPVIGVRIAQLVVCGIHLCIGRDPIAVDGIIGPQTQGALNTIATRYEAPLLAWLNWAQGARYMRLWMGSSVLPLSRLRGPDLALSQWRHFMVGWGRRLHAPASLIERHGLH